MPPSVPRESLTGKAARRSGAQGTSPPDDQLPRDTRRQSSHKAKSKALDDHLWQVDLPRAAGSKRPPSSTIASSRQKRIKDKENNAAQQVMQLRPMHNRPLLP
ncbi:hypothetical protein WOLCODRAFT_137607 [Wolfiporia cocos MD-104 SS10]|uniref:Uncharacterized protein n=1 Tax=Wolfiporia cocos (strain MD-104) TaxID=742152 RepID=A0A2H3K0D6_WOLCO|nr:hypothetical protein WOLCODRAFT_137607 [Wolfiporia cocos MD-104 SS10]